MAELQSESLVGDDAAVARISLTLKPQAGEDQTVFEGLGTSKKHPTDGVDKKVGEAYAYVRALRQLADDVEQWADKKSDPELESFYSRWAREATQSMAASVYRYYQAVNRPTSPNDTVFLHPYKGA